jgi:hypothetical protein
MSLLTPFIASTSDRGWIELLILFCVLVLDYWATMRIITQAGYSSLWVALPLAPLVLTVICYAILWRDLHEIYFGGGFGFGGINNESLFWHLDEFSILLNWIFYLVFAFSRWPVSGEDRTRDFALRPSELPRANPRSPSRQPETTAPIPGGRALPVTAAGPSPGSASVAESPATKRPGALFCAWCGEPLPGNRAIFHDCGPKERPETFCKNCGAALPAGSAECSSCAAA